MSDIFSHAMPLMIVILCVMAIAYRYYSAFLAARVATLNDLRETPAVRINDGQNFHPTNKWVLFGHHFAAISGAGPLIGPVLAAQFGYLPGLIWIVIGVCLAGAVQDFLVLAASIRRGGRSLAQIAFEDLGKAAGTACMVAILFIIIIALAGLGKVVVKALGGETVAYPADARLVFPESIAPKLLASEQPKGATGYDQLWAIPKGGTLIWNQGKSQMEFTDSFHMRFPAVTSDAIQQFESTGLLPPNAVRLVPGSSWGTFTIACTIPIALFVGLYMYKIRPGKVFEASIIGAILTLGATFLGGLVPGSSIERFFNLSDMGVTWSMAVYGFVASVLPVWILLCPRDYLSSFLKIGTIALLVVGVIVANPRLEAPAVNQTFITGGPTVPGHIFPFLFITIMCGAISGFHSLVSSGTTPKMIKRESDARTIGYASMLIEGLVGCCAMIAAATLPLGDYYAMNTDLAKVPQFHDKFVEIGADIDHLNVYEDRTQEALRGRTGGAVTLAVGMAHIFDGVVQRFTTATEETLKTLWKYWYHFAIMFEALFILTTIDTGTRIGRFLLQEFLGKTIHPKLGETSWMPGAIFSTAVIVAGWTFFISANSMAAIWPMFGIANQMLAVIALAVVSGYLMNEGKTKYLWVTILPMIFVFTTTSSGAVMKLIGKFQGIKAMLKQPTESRNLTQLIYAFVESGLVIAMLVCTIIIISQMLIRLWAKTAPKPAEVAAGE